MRNILAIGALLAVLSSAGMADATKGDVAELLDALKSREQSVRLEAIDYLGLMGEKAAGAVSALTDLLKDNSPAVRAHAAESLGEIGAPAKSAASVLASVLTDPEAAVRRKAIEALRSIRPGPEVGIPLMIKMLEDVDPSVRMQALHALTESGESAVPFLIGALKKDGVDYWACLVVSEIGLDAKDAVPALIELLDDEEPGVRREAILALAAIGAPAAPAIRPLFKALDDDVNRIPAIYALGNIGNVSDPVKAKIRSFGRSSDAVLQTVSIWSLARLDPDNERLTRGAAEMLINQLTDEDPRARQAAAQALIDLDLDPEITRPMMTKVMESASPEALDDILDALATLGEKAVPQLSEALQHEAVRAEAAAIVARIGPPAKAAVPALIETLDDKDPKTRIELLFALAAIGPDAEAAVPALTKALNDPDVNVRYGACHALGKVGPAAMSAKAVLQKNLGDADSFLSTSSAWALACIDPGCKETCKKSVPVLIEAMGESEVMIRLQAAEALQCLGPLAKDAIGALKKALSDENGEVRDVAAQALKAIGN